MTFLQKFYRALKHASIKVEAYNEGFIKEVRQDVNICHEGKRLYFTLRAEARLHSPDNARNFSTRDAQGTFEIIVWQTRKRLSGIVYTTDTLGAGPILASVSEEPVFGFFKHRLETRAAFTEQELVSCTKKWQQVVQRLCSWRPIGWHCV